VYKARCTLSNQVVVLKVYTPASVCDLYKYQIYREVALHSRLQHENVVTLHAAFQECDKVRAWQETTPTCARAHTHTNSPRRYRVYV
jgi:serine/threonine protein kinase